MRFFKIFIVLIIISSIYYLNIPEPEYPNPPSESLQSNEPGDTETPLRRSYFTDLSREEVINHYKKEFNSDTNIFFSFMNINLNYPPELAQILIRDQTRSTFLEEIAHPFREYLFINGFKPEEDKDVIFVNNKLWKQKITIKYIPTNALLRTVIFLASSAIFINLIKEWKDSLVKIISIIRRK